MPVVSKIIFSLTFSIIFNDESSIKKDFVKSITKIVIMKSIIYVKEPLTFVIRINSVHITFPEMSQMDNLQI